MASPPGAESRADPGEQDTAAALQAELSACREQLERARRRLRRAQRLYRRERESGEALRRQVGPPAPDIAASEPSAPPGREQLGPRSACPLLPMCPFHTVPRLPVLAGLPRPARDPEQV